MLTFTVVHGITLTDKDTYLGVWGHSLVILAGSKPTLFMVLHGVSPICEVAPAVAVRRWSKGGLGPRRVGVRRRRRVSSLRYAYQIWGTGRPALAGANTFAVTASASPEGACQMTDTITQAGESRVVEFFLLASLHRGYTPYKRLGEGHAGRGAVTAARLHEASSRGATVATR